MPVKILCPKCAAEIHDPADLKSVTCHTCRFTFDFSDHPTVVTPASSATPAPSGPVLTRLGKYDIQAEISRGGMGIVYRGYQRDLDRHVAIKVVSPELAREPEFVERFLREARALARLNHPHVVQVYDVDRDGDRLFLVMELVEGQSLRALLKAGPVAPPDALRIASQVCDAIDFAHAQGIVHRDIKPENVLVTSKGEAKIADFGLAVLFTVDPHTPRLTQSNVVLGTFDYMAPEQRQAAGRVDHRADIYALGVVLYELLTRRLPVGRFEPPSKAAPVDARLDDVVLRALEQEPEKRWPRASQIREKLVWIAATAPSPEATKPTERRRAEPHPAWKMNVPWTAAAALCLIVLVALWITAHRVKKQKLEARYGEPIPEAPAKPRLRVSADRKITPPPGVQARTLTEYFAAAAKTRPGQAADVEIEAGAPPMRQREVLEEASRHGVPVRFVTGDSGLARIVLHRGDRLRVEDFTLHFWERVENVSVYDARGVHCVEFVRIKKGDRRAWQELQLTFLEVEKDDFTIEVEMKPGAACHGKGFYRNLRPGLRIEFSNQRSLTIAHWDPARPEMKLVIEGFGKTEERTFGLKGEARVLTVYYRLLDGKDGDLMLLVDDLD